VLYGRFELAQSSVNWIKMARNQAIWKGKKWKEPQRNMGHVQTFQRMCNGRREKGAKKFYLMNMYFKNETRKAYVLPNLTYDIL
jgi:hypothetical protein